jgi:hypothetical protein
MRHGLKIWTDYFDDVESGTMPFQVRLNDRHFRVGDTLRLVEWDTSKGRFTGRETTKLIVSMLEGAGPGAIPPLVGIRKDYVVLGLAPVTKGSN